MANEPITMANRYLTVTVDHTGLPALRDERTGVSWRPFEAGPGPQLAFADPDGRSHVADLRTDSKCTVRQVNDGRVRVDYRGLETEDLVLPGFALTVDLALDGDRAAVDISIEALDLGPGMWLTSMAYPNYHLALRTTYDDGYLVVPTKQGVIVPTRFEVGFMRYQHNTWAKIADQEHTLAFDTGALNMPWYGAVKNVDGEQSALLCVVETPADAALTVRCNKVVPTPASAQPDDEASQGQRLSTLTPLWRSSHGGLGYARRLHLEVIPGGGYVEMAQRYREIAMANGRYRSLRDKIAENPAVGRLVGAPDIKLYVYTNRPERPFYRAYSEPVLSGYERVHTTFAQVAEIAKELDEGLGIDRALILLGGWIRAGYDREHPDVWPPAEKAGGVAGLAEASREAAARGYLFALHDNYQDMYPDAPSYDAGAVMRDPEGELRPGGIWDGGRCQLICSTQAIALATATLDAVQGETATNGYYLDTTTAAPLYECFSAAHPLTRREDREQKLALLRWLHDRGLVVGGEGGIDWAIGVCSFFEGLPGASTGFFDGVTGPRFGIAAPLFALVYHDAVVAYWQHGQPFGREDHDNHFLADLLAANPSSWVLVADQWEDLKPLIKEAAEILGALHRRTAHQPMVGHRYLTEDFTVQESVFGDGTRVVVNFGITSFTLGDLVIAPKGFVIEEPEGNVVQGVVRRHCEIMGGGR